VHGHWWEVLDELGVTLLLTREYEHLLVALGTDAHGPNISYWPMPHPSGMAVDRESGKVFVACTRNPNQIVEMRPVNGLMPRLDHKQSPPPRGVLIPVASRLYPGCLYMHDLAFIGQDLYANSVGQNAIIRLDAQGGQEVTWWPKCVDSSEGPILGRNHIQLNSIAAGPNLAGSYFSASTDKVTLRRPGHKNFPVDKKGVIFSGATREPIAFGLTRPHSTRMHDGRIWVDNSGYGEFGWVEGGTLRPVLTLPGWTRGLSFCKNIAFVGTSRVIPRFANYAPGLDVGKSVCAVHAVDLLTGRVLGSIQWPTGNQIFAIEWLPAQLVQSLALTVNKQTAASTHNLFYAYRQPS
jgi:uncharacterized protein (TIGR03032 family)